MTVLGIVFAWNDIAGMGNGGTHAAWQPPLFIHVSIKKVPPGKLVAAGRF